MSEFLRQPSGASLRESNAMKDRAPLLNSGEGRSSLIKESDSPQVFSSAKIGSIEAEVEQLNQEVKEEIKEEASEEQKEDQTWTCWKAVKG